jgi:hypothetical protein
MEGVYGREKKNNPHATEHMLRTAHVAYCIHISHLSIETDKTMKLNNARKLK